MTQLYEEPPSNEMMCSIIPGHGLSCRTLALGNPAVQSEQMFQSRTTKFALPSADFEVCALTCFSITHVDDLGNTVYGFVSLSTNILAYGTCYFDRDLGTCYFDRDLEQFHQKPRFH